MSPEPPVLPPGRTLLLVCAYRGANRARAPKPGSWAAHIALYRDYYANPRSAEIQRQVIERVLGPAMSDVDIRVDDAVSAIWPNRKAQQLQAFTASEARSYDTVILAYPDALGLSWGALESRFVGAGKTVAVLNGRGRFFRLTPDLKSALGFRRFLAETRLAEMIMGLVSVPAAAILATYDAARGRS